MVLCVFLCWSQTKLFGRHQIWRVVAATRYLNLKWRIKLWSGKSIRHQSQSSLVRSRPISEHQEDIKEIKNDGHNGVGVAVLKVVPITRVIQYSWVRDNMPGRNHNRPTLLITDTTPIFKSLTSGKPSCSSSAQHKSHQWALARHKRNSSEDA